MIRAASIALATLIAEPALASTTWFCSVATETPDKPALVRYEVDGNQMKELTSADVLKQWGVKPNERLRVVENSPSGLVALASDAQQRNDATSVYAHLIVINKRTGEMRETSLSAGESPTGQTLDPVRRGTCATR